MRRLLTLAFNLSLSFAILSGCTAIQQENLTEQLQKTVSYPESTPFEATETAPSAQPDPKSDYAISLKGTRLSLHDSNDEVDLPALLGTPLTEKTYTLQNADTLTGSFMQELTFPGLEMQLFSPKQDGKSFWIMNMRITDAAYVTSKGLRVGMLFKDLKTVYPDIQPNNGNDADPENSTYEIGSQETYDYARFEVKEGVIREIYLHHDIP
ncbi:hypothetical protein [Paenibacillus pedocola]|uniref:hypothetical protein n=1 Tax=Paenibacillus pedocola TaxID=3242193 RepID=UPI002877C3C5|nr:hypothetical protein [Paenibacillus typhae]